MTILRAEIPEKLHRLFEPARYKVAFGGRGAGKSWALADALLIQGAEKPLRILCARDLQKSMRESSHQLLRDRIRALGFDNFYEVLADEIRGSNGTQFFFAGLRHNVENIKSKEGIDRVWVEEAAKVSGHSWETLIPTIRKEDSEIWVSFNPELETDETYRRFIANPQPGTILIPIGWRDNPWFPKVLEKERDYLRETDPDAYNNIWEGHCRQWLDGAIYANELRKATAEGRITDVPYDPSKPVHTAWDLGEADMTAIWFYQKVGFNWHVIDYYENSGHKLLHYLKELQSRSYVYGTDWLPHDAEAETVGSPKSISRQAREFGRKVSIVPKLSLVSGINQARTLFDTAYFDQKKCADGINCLRNYQYKVDADGEKRSREPLHNWASHGADAFRYLAVSAKGEEATPKIVAPVVQHRPNGSGQGWMRR